MLLLRRRERQKGKDTPTGNNWSSYGLITMFHYNPFYNQLTIRQLWYFTNCKSSIGIASATVGGGVHCHEVLCIMYWHRWLEYGHRCGYNTNRGLSHIHRLFTFRLRRRKIRAWQYECDSIHLYAMEKQHGMSQFEWARNRLLTVRNLGLVIRI